MGARVHLLADPVIRVRRDDATIVRRSLPELYADLVADNIMGFPALRPHQRHPLHALLAQLGAVALVRADIAEPPTTAVAWRDLLAALTPDYPAGEPWQLVAAPEAPAFLQPPVGPLTALKPRPLATPDELDMLVTARNHDLKAARMADAEPDDWLFALVALQTAEGYLGKGNFGISRMNGGFANRPGVGISPPGGVGAHIIRDIRRLVALREAFLDRWDEYAADGPALLWLIPWDGKGSLRRAGLDPYYIEICRRIRLVGTEGRIAAHVGNSTVARIAMGEDENGVTGDPWTPIVSKDNEPRALSMTVEGFGYRRVAAILTNDGYTPSALQALGPGEDGAGWSLVCRATVRGQGKTEGHHERRIALPQRVVGRLRQGELRDIGALAKERVEDAAVVRRALRFALMTLFQNGPETVQPKDPSSTRRTDRLLPRFEAEVDRDFFERLFDEAGEAERDARLILRTAWLRDLHDRARKILVAAEAGSPVSVVRRHRAVVRADRALDRGVLGAKEFRGRLGVADAA